MDAIILFVLMSSIGVLYLLIRPKHQRVTMPGPRGWPIVGNVFQMDSEHPYITLSSWAEIYGDVFTIRKFSKHVVVCNSFEAIWELYVTKSNEFAGRPQVFPLSYTFENADAAICDFTPEWMRRKKVFMTAIQRYGISQWEDNVREIINDLLNNLRQTQGKPVDPMEVIQFTLLDILSLTLYGSRFRRSDQDFKLLQYVLLEAGKIWAPSLLFFLLDAFPFMKNLPVRGCQRLDWYVNTFNRTWISKQWKKRKEVYDPENLSCVLDGIVKQYEEDLVNNELYPIKEINVRLMSSNFITAGMNTSTSALYSTLAILPNFPDVQSRAQREVDQGLRGRPPHCKDRESLPYIQAFIEEVFRYTTILPLSVQHKSTQDTSICGYDIPKGTEMWPNIWYLCHDTNFWGDPWIFRPERFLDEDGKLLPSDHPFRKRVLVFGAGRRVCAGEVMAKTRLFLIIASLLQTFTFLPESEDKKPKYDPRTYPLAFAVQPANYRIRCIPRNL